MKCQVDVAQGESKASIVNGCEFHPDLSASKTHIDASAAAAVAVDGLYEAGHRRSAVITGPVISRLTRDRLNGALAAVVASDAALTIMTQEWDLDLLVQTDRSPDILFYA